MTIESILWKRICLKVLSSSIANNTRACSLQDKNVFVQIRYCWVWSRKYDITVVVCFRQLGNRSSSIFLTWETMANPASWNIVAIVSPVYHENLWIVFVQVFVELPWSFRSFAGDLASSRATFCNYKTRRVKKNQAYFSNDVHRIASLLLAKCDIVRDTKRQRIKCIYNQTRLHSVVQFVSVHVFVS